MLVLVESNGNDDDAFAPSSSSSKSDSSSSSSIKTPLSLLANCSFTKISPTFELNPSCSQSARKNTSHRIAVGNVVSVEFLPATVAPISEVLLLSPNGIRKITSRSSLSCKTIPPIPILCVNTNSDVDIVSICKDFSHCLNRTSANCLSMSSSSFNSRLTYLSFPVGEILI